MAENYYISSDTMFVAMGLLESIAINKILLNLGYPIPQGHTNPVEIESPNNHLYDVLSIVFGKQSFFQSSNHETFVLCVPKTFFKDNGEKLITIKRFTCEYMWEVMELTITEEGEYLTLKIEGENLSLGTFRIIMDLIKDHKRKKVNEWN